MTISEDRLLAYVDGLLSPEDAAEVERALADDAGAQALVAALRRSALPYREAAEAGIPVPDLSDIESDLERGKQPPRRYLRWARIAAMIAVVFAAGIVAGRYALPPAPPAPPEKSQWARWIDDIATYQALYTRATLSLPTPPPDRRKRQMKRVGEALGAPVPDPDLAAVGAEFKYARMYALDGEPLAQIAYLPTEGKPFSICLMKTPVADHEPRYTTSRGLNVATWRHRGVAYVFVGDTPRTQMDRYIAAIRRQQGA